MQVETGLANLGNTCFMNSSLQLLLHIEPLVNYFRSGKHAADLNKNSPTRGEVAKSFYKLIQDIEANTQQKNQGLNTASSVSPFELQKAVGNFAPYLMDYSQQDCQEFLRFLLDGLGEDLKRAESNVIAPALPLKTTTNDDNPLAATMPANAISGISGMSSPGSTKPICSASAPSSPTKMSLADKLRMQTLENRDEPPRSLNNNDEEIDDPNEFINKKSSQRQTTGNTDHSLLHHDTEVGQPSATEVVDGSEVPVESPIVNPEGAGDSPAAPSAPPLDYAAQAEKAWRDYVRKNDSIITDIFAGQLQSTVECSVCQHKSYTFDPFLDLSVPVPSAPKHVDTSGVEKSMSMLHNTARSVSTYVSNATTRITPWRVRAQAAPVPLDPGVYPLKSPAAGDKDAQARGDGADVASRCTLGDCLAQFTAEEMLDNENMYLCEKCNQRRKCSKTLKILKYPKVLVIHLNRFRYSSYTREKVHTDVKFPTKSLSITPFMEFHHASSTGTDSTNPDESDNPSESLPHVVENGTTDPLGATGGSNASDEDPATSPAEHTPLSSTFSAPELSPANVASSVTTAKTTGDEPARPAVLYDLAGISHHSGSMSGGHYIAHIDILNGQNCSNSVQTGAVDEISFKSDSSATDGLVTNPAEKAADKEAGGAPSKWMCFNDARVSAISSSSIGGPTAYVLFYTLREPSNHAVPNNLPLTMVPPDRRVIPGELPIPSIPRAFHAEELHPALQPASNECPAN